MKNQFFMVNQPLNLLGILFHIDHDITISAKRLSSPSPTTWPGRTARYAGPRGAKVGQKLGDLEHSDLNIVILIVVNRV